MQADTLCQRTSALIRDGLQPYIDEGREAVETAEGSANMVREIVAPNLEALVVAIAGLKWPPGDAARLKALLAELQEVAEEGREDPRRLILHDHRAMSDARRLADANGFSKCGRLRIVLPDKDSEADDSDIDFAAGADALCRRATAIVQAELQPYVGRGTRAVSRPAAIEKMAGAIALELEAMGGAIQRLNWADRGEGEIQPFLDALRELYDADLEEPKRLLFDTRHVLAPARDLAEDADLAYCGKFWIVLPNARSDTRLL